MAMDAAIAENTAKAKDAAKVKDATRAKHAAQAKNLSQDGLPPSTLASIAKPCNVSSSRKKRFLKQSKLKRKTGVVYLSRVPPGLDVGIVRSILGRVGPLGRVWLRAEEKETVAARRSIGGRRRVGFSDGWVEFLRYVDAESAVELLNGQPMTGATRRGRFENDLWCLRLLPEFKWDDLVDEACGTRRERVLRVKSEVAASRRERSFFEQRSALAKSIERSERRKANEAELEIDSAGNKSEILDVSSDPNVEALSGKRLVRLYRQKCPVDDENGNHDLDEKCGLQRLEREQVGDGSAIDADLISKLFKKRKVVLE